LTSPGAPQKQNEKMVKMFIYQAEVITEKTATVCPLRRLLRSLDNKKYLVSFSFDSINFYPFLTDKKGKK
jgi:hypothetical protein